MDSDECCIIIASMLLLTYVAFIHTKRRRRRWAVRPINRVRAENGFFNNLLTSMLVKDHDSFLRYTRIMPNVFFSLLKLVEPHLRKDPTKNPLPPAHRLIITLYYLAEGCSMQELAWGHYLGKSTISTIIKETTKVLWDVLKIKCLAVPNVDTWNKIQKQFYNRWNMPNCVGAIGGKHITIQCPMNTGSEYFNYKKSFSIVLMAACDANYKFISVDIGAAGGNHDSVVFPESGFGNAVLKKNLTFLRRSKLPNSQHVLQNFFVADSAFPLHENIIRPYPGLYLNEEQKIFNYRLSRARRTIENTFGICTARWRILRRPIIAKLETCEKIAQACVVLHNFVQTTEEEVDPGNRRYCPVGYADQVLANSNIIPGAWREEGQLKSVGRVGANNSKVRDKETRDILAQYFNSSEGSVPWQYDYILKGAVPSSFTMNF